MKRKRAPEKEGAASKAKKVKSARNAKNARNAEKVNKVDNVATSAPVILFVAGSMGRMTGEDDATGTVTSPQTAQRSMLSRHGVVVGPVRSLTGVRLSGGAGAGMSRLVAIKKALADVRRAHPHRKVFLATQSAGGRMVAHLFSGMWQTKPKKDGQCARFPLGVVPESGGAASAGIIKKAKALIEDYPEFCNPECSIPTGVCGLMIFGYPLAHKTQDRSVIFSSIKPSCPPLLFITGDKDDMGRGLESALAKCHADVSTTLVRVPGAGHDCWNPYNEQRHELMHTAIASFIRKCSAE